ncbi:filamentation protein-like protein [Setomelanomma holmii]|uniref:Filamentation protein-like protein n=1 Tax=Setomelanomma holmii TaxID=210430 RepID=A0A9P4GXD7_9PLEO|nr:filamentation protein-like protein [Setomelanomma holmii]
MVNAPESEKAQRYIQQLDEARCAGRWSDVPELCRKVEKHAPHRKCLTHTARSEAQIAAYSTQRPSTAASTASHGLSQIIPSLLTTIESEGELSQDAFQATVCLGWLHYVLEEPGLAVARFPKDFGAVATAMSGSTGSLSGWSRVCLVKGTYLKGSTQEKTGTTGDAVYTYSSVVPWLSSASATAHSAQSKMWTERLLVRLCQLSDQSVGAGEHISSTEALRTYRYWATFWDANGKGAGSETATAARHRRLAWKAYYDTLSTILRHNLAYETETLPATTEKPPLQSQSSLRLRQRAELKRVETVYEGLLIKETRFPKASETNYEIEAWVDSVMDNWRLLCGPTWTDADLGEGGKEGIGRSVLDILYRAATKTFHSTPVLRYLFVVHASLAEFELAFTAYDSYVEIITRGKDRVEKSGEADVGIDSDSAVLRTSAEAIRLLCRFGSRREAEKALDIGHHIEKWLEQSEHIRSASDAGSVTSTNTLVEPAALATVYCAIGISQAHWARYTYEVERRADFQAKAVQYVRRSLSPSLGESGNVEALYVLALVLAETRDVPGAIKVVKRALSPLTRETTTMSTDGVLSNGLQSEFGRERRLIPLWHLLALLLTSRSDLGAAEKACEAAFEQFGDPAILFGQDEGGFRSEQLNETALKDAASGGIVDRMEGFEKSSILQIKMTQLALVEMTEGAVSAVDGCDELLALYSRLFGDPAGDKARLEVSKTTIVPPKSAVGTIRGSIFRGSGSVKTSHKESPARNPSVLSSKASAVATQSGAPAIQVTEEDGTTHANGHHHRHHLFHHSHEEKQSGIGRSRSKLQKRSSASLRRQSAADADHAPDVPPFPENVTNGTPAQANLSRTKSSRRQSVSSSQRKSVETSDRPLRDIPHNVSYTSPPLEQPDQPPKQDVRLPVPFPHADYVPSDPRFSRIQERRLKVSLLVDIWIFISGLYSRAQMFQDAREAVAEALKLVETFEAEVAQESSTAKSLSEKGWGGGKSVEELWADAFAARGELQVAQSLNFQGRTDFERALLHFPDHRQGIVGLSNILLDIYSEVIPLEPSQETQIASPSSQPTTQPNQKAASDLKTRHLTSHIPSAENHLSSPVLSRLAARDRAFGLLSTLTKLGSGWDYSEAWYALARAYEESGQVEKTKEVLWWCVELEDTHPIRNWDSVALGGFVL